MEWTTPTQAPSNETAVPAASPPEWVPILSTPDTLGVAPDLVLGFKDCELQPRLTLQLS